MLPSELLVVVLLELVWVLLSVLRLRLLLTLLLSVLHCRSRNSCK